MPACLLLPARLSHSSQGFRVLPFRRWRGQLLMIRDRHRQAALTTAQDSLHSTLQPPPALQAQGQVTAEIACNLLIHECRVKRQKGECCGAIRGVMFPLSCIDGIFECATCPNWPAVQDWASVSSEQVVTAALQAHTALHAGTLGVGKCRGT